MAERAKQLRLKLKKEKEEQKEREESSMNMVNESKPNPEEAKQPIIRFKKIEVSDDEDKDSDDSSCFEPPPMRKSMFPRSKTPVLRKSQKLTKEMDVDNDDIEPLTFLNNLNGNNNEYQMPQVDLGFDLDKLISGNTNNNDERSLVNSSLNDSNVNREMPAMKLNLMDIMQARFNLKEVSIRNSRKMKSSLKQPNEQTNTNNEDCSNAIPLRKLSPSKTKVSNLLVEKSWDKDLNGMINQKVEALKLLPGSNANNKIQIMLEKERQ